MIDRAETFVFGLRNCPYLPWKLAYRITAANMCRNSTIGKWFLAVILIETTVIKVTQNQWNLITSREKIHTKIVKIVKSEILCIHLEHDTSQSTTTHTHLAMPHKTWLGAYNLLRPRQILQASFPHAIFFNCSCRNVTGICYQDSNRR